MIFVILYVLLINIKWFKEKYHYDDWVDVLNFIVGSIFIIAIAVFGFNYFTTMGSVAELEAFQNEVLSAYENTVDKSENIIIYAVKDSEEEFGNMINTGNLAYFELARSVNENLQELRNEIRDYNNSLYTLKMYDSNWFTGSFVYNVPEYLKPIKMK